MPKEMQSRSRVVGEVGREVLGRDSISISREWHPEENPPGVTKLGMDGMV